MNVLLCCLLLLVPAAATATAPAFVQSCSNSDCGLSSISCSLTTTTGNTYVVAAGYVCLDTLPLVSSVTNTASDTFTKIVSIDNVFENVEVWAVLAGTSSTSFTVNFDSSCADSSLFIAVAEYSGVDSINGTTSATTGGGDPIEITHNNQATNSRLVAVVCPGGTCDLINPSDNSRELIVFQSCPTVGGSFGLQDAAVASTGNKTFSWGTGGCGWPAVVIELDSPSANSATTTATRTNSGTVTATVTATATFTITPTPNPAPPVCDQLWSTAEVGAHGGPQVIDMRSNEIVATPNDPIYAEDNLGIWFAPNGEFVTTATYLGASLWKYSTTAPFVGQFVAPAEANRGVIVSANSELAYFSNPLEPAIYVVDTAPWTIIATISEGGTVNGAGLALTANDTRLWNTFNFGGPEGIRVYNTSTWAIAATIITDAQGFDSTTITAPNGSFVYSTNNGSSTVICVNASTYAIVATISTNANPLGLAISPNGSRAYVTTCCVDPGINVINTVTNTIIATAALSYHPHGNFVSSDNKALWVCDYEMGTDKFHIKKYSTAALESGTLTLLADIQTEDEQAWAANSIAILHTPLCRPPGKSPNKHGCR